MGLVLSNAVLPTLMFTTCLEFVPCASFISGNFVFIVRFLKNTLECFKDHSNALLEAPWVSADGSSLTGLCRTSLLAQWSPVSWVWQVVCSHLAHCWKRREVVIWVPTAGRRASPPLAQSNTKICCPRGCKREVDGARRPSLLPTLVHEQQPSCLWWIETAVHSLSFSATARQQPLSLWQAQDGAFPEAFMNGRLLVLRGGKGREESPILPLHLCLLSLYLLMCTVLLQHGVNLIKSKCSVLLRQTSYKNLNLSHLL